MSRRRTAVAIFAIAAVSVLAGCELKSCGNPNSPSGGGSAAFTDDGGVRFMGIQPAPLVASGTTYVYQNTATDGVTVQASSDGLTFAPTPATYPAGASRSIVSLPDGRFRMYYYPDGTSIDIRSAVSSNGLNWTVEGGIRFSEPGSGGLRATTLPTGGYRLYYVNSAGSISSVMSSDGLTFVAEGPVAILAPDGTFTWGASAAAYLNGQFHMVLTKAPSSGVSNLWHAVSADGRNWNVDRNPLAADPANPLNQPAWSINGSTARIYFRAQPSGGGNAIVSGIVRF